MYWLLSDAGKAKVRTKIDALVFELAHIDHTPPHADQIFPFQGRKAIEHAKTVIELLSDENDLICDPFVGSGSFAYAASQQDREVSANEFEIYTYEMAKLPFSLPDKDKLLKSFFNFIQKVKPQIDHWYRTKCPCGAILPIESLFYDREPLEYINIERHERLGPHGENIVYRNKKFKCKRCKRSSKFFDKYDQRVLKEIDKIVVNFPNNSLIENSRINLSGEFTKYSNLFPQRSKVVLSYLFDSINTIIKNDSIKDFFTKVLLSIIPLAKYKDYRSKSQDLHCPHKKLRESNILNAFEKQFLKRFKTLYSYNLNKQTINFTCLDFRDHMKSLASSSVGLIITDPPWNDGNAYFERAQLYHPFIGYNLSKDKERLHKEMIVSDAPSRSDKHGKEQWWTDLTDFFEQSYRILKEHRFLVLYFRPVPAREWISNLNRLKLLARKSGFEPLLTVDLSNSDPSMRIQQSAHYAFSSDLIITFLRLKPGERRNYFKDHDIDELAFITAVNTQETQAGPFSKKAWSSLMHAKLVELNLLALTAPKKRNLLEESFSRVCEEVTPGGYLPKPTTPYSDEIFGTPYIERVSLYVPHVLEELLNASDKFTFDQFLIKIAEFVENGTRSILENILTDKENSLKNLLDMYATPIPGGLYFTKRPAPTIPDNILEILDLDPYEFEKFAFKLLELEGYKNLALTGRSGDRGVDIRCIDDKGQLVVVQCKRYTRSKVGSEPIQRLHSYAMTRGASRKICITTTDFTRDGMDEAKKASVELINRDMLNELVHKHKMFARH